MRSHFFHRGSGIRWLFSVSLLALLLGAWLFPAAVTASGTLDQQQTSDSGSEFGIGDNFWGAQVFQAGITGKLTQVDINFIAYNSTTVVRIEGVNGSGKPNGTVKGSVTLSGTGSGWTSIDFTAANITSTAGTTYAIVISGGNNSTNWEYGSGNPYTNGNGWFSSDSGGSWSNFSSGDFMFKTYVTLPTAVSIGDVSLAEGNSGTTAFNFPVTLSAVSTQDVTVDYATVNGTATTGDSDYQAASGVLTIPHGSMGGTITVNVNGDTKVEANETFKVKLSNPFNASIATGTGTGTILNDDVRFTVAGYLTPTTAGDSHTFTVTATDAAGTATGYRGTVHFTSSDPQAALPADYTFTAADSGVHTFTATLKTAGTQSITATDTVTSDYTGKQMGIVVNAAAPASIEAMGGGQSALTTTTFTNKLSVTIKDLFGNPVPGVSITFTAPASGASGTFANGTTTTTAVTNASGVATASKFTANKVPGGYDVLANFTSGTPSWPDVGFSLTNILGTPSYDVKVTNVTPTSVKPGVNFTYTFTIKNTGTADSINTTATYPLPNTVTFGSASGDHNFACGAVGPPNATTMQCTGGRIAIGETATITLTVATPLNAPPGEVIATNTLTVVGTADGQGTGDGGTGTGSGTSAQTVTIQDPGWSAPPA